MLCELGVIAPGVRIIHRPAQKHRPHLLLLGGQAHRTLGGRGGIILGKRPHGLEIMGRYIDHLDLLEGCVRVEAHLFEQPTAIQIGHDLLIRGRRILGHLQVHRVRLLDDPKEPLKHPLGHLGVELGDRLADHHAQRRRIKDVIRQWQRTVRQIPCQFPLDEGLLDLGEGEEQHERRKENAHQERSHCDGYRFLHVFPPWFGIDLPKTPALRVTSMVAADSSDQRTPVYAMFLVGLDLQRPQFLDHACVGLLDLHQIGILVLVALGQRVEQLGVQQRVAPQTSIGCQDRPTVEVDPACALELALEVNPPRGPYPSPATLDRG